MGWHYIDTNRSYPLSQNEMEDNVDQIYAQLYSGYTWSINAICAVLGNMEYESYLNPAQTQGGYPTDSMHGGYGLVQWTPASKIKNWCQQNNHSIYSGYWQCYYLANEYSGEWIPTTNYPESFAEFTHSGQTLDYLTKCFFYNYERGTWNNQRVTMAENWYRYLMGTDPPPEPTPTPPQPPDPPPTPDPDPSRYRRNLSDIYWLRSRNLIF